MTDVKDRPEASADAELILKLQDKLDSLKNQVHTWTAKAKGKPRNCQGMIRLHSRKGAQCVNLKGYSAAPM
jgi:hypothetical protein